MGVFKCFGKDSERAKKRAKKEAAEKLLPDILRDIAEHPERYADPEMREILGHVKEHGVSVFPYPFAAKYDPASLEVFTDKDSGLKYIMQNGYRLYYKRSMRKFWRRNDKPLDRRAAKYFNGLMAEQDPASPHCYAAGGFGVEEGSVLFDIGSAEGNYALANIDKVSRVFIFEIEEPWLDALQHTFAPWKDKVVIINKFVSDTDGGNTLTVDTVVRDYGIKEPVFLKMDVEGAESSVLRGAKETLSRPDTKAVICTYHRQNDHAELSAMMESAGYDVRTSPGYMLFLYGVFGLEPPYFRRGLIYCTKRKEK